MALTALETKPLDAITAEDIHAFVAGRDVVESQTLEFKQQVGQFALRRAACAFANAYGGAFVIGVVEADGVAADLLPIENCVAEAARYAQGLADSLSPPVLGLQARGIPLHGAAGVVVLRIPASPRRPHATTKQGEGDALFVFVRRGAESKPAGMREVQDMTIAAMSQSRRALERLTALQKPILDDRAGLPRYDRSPFMFHVCATPAVPISLPRVGRNADLEISEVDAPSPVGRLRFQWLGWRWRSIFRGRRMERHEAGHQCVAAIYADGSCELLFRHEPFGAGDRPPDTLRLSLCEVLGMTAAVALWCEKIRAAAEEPLLEFATTSFIACDRDHIRMEEENRGVGRLGVLPQGLFVTEPTQLIGAEDVQRLLNAAVSDFHNLAGLGGPEADSAFDLSPIREAWRLPNA